MLPLQAARAGAALPLLGLDDQMSRLEGAALPLTTLSRSRLEGAALPHFIVDCKDVAARRRRAAAVLIGFWNRATSSLRSRLEGAALPLS